MSSPAFSSSVPVGVWGSRPHVQGVCPRESSKPIFATPSAPMWRMKVLSLPTFKSALLEKVQPLNFGRAVADERAQQEEVEALIRQVEATNKSVSPGTDPNLSGVWDMVYTTSTSVMGVGKPSFLQAKRIVQELNAAELTARNVETFQFGPFKVVNAIEAKLTPVSAKRFDVNFLQFVLLGFIKINVEKNDRFRGWLEVTYLDEDLRISRGNQGNVFVLVKK